MHVLYVQGSKIAQKTSKVIQYKDNPNKTKIFNCLTLENRQNGCYSMKSLVTFFRDLLSSCSQVALLSQVAHTHLYELGKAKKIPTNSYLLCRHTNL